MKCDPLDIYKPLKSFIDMSKIKVHNSDYELAMAVMNLKIGDICLIEVNAETSNLLFCKKGRDGIVEFHVMTTTAKEETYLTKIKASYVGTARSLFRSMK